MLALILARAGLRVTLLEKHDDFIRDFRGDTIHPSTLGLLGELGLRDAFLVRPHSTVTTMDVVVSGTRLHPMDFATLRPPNNFLVRMPQWDFLTFLVDHATAYNGFDLHLGTEVTGLLRENGRVVGVRARSREGELEVRAPLTVAADGRDSVVRTASGLVPTELGVAVDVLWFRLPKPADPPPPTLAYIDGESMVLTIERADYYQAGMVIAKGGFEQIVARGLDAFRARVTATAPHLAEVLGALADWGQVKLLSVQVNRLERWHLPGLLLIGDAAHAMSPVFGIGVNYAIHDAVATANALLKPLRAGVVTEKQCAAVQRRRLSPVRRMQRLQLFAHRVIARPDAALPNRLPAPVRMLFAVFAPLVQRYAARLVGIGYRPEHLSPELREPTPPATPPRPPAPLG